VIERATAPRRGDELNAQFAALVYADEDLLCAEFDAIIAAGWGSARPYRLREFAGTSPPMRNEPPSARTARRTTPRWSPTVAAPARQRSPPPADRGSCRVERTVMPT
jgi:hypothetical protein